MSENKGFFSRLFGRKDETLREETRDLPDENAQRPEHDREKSAASAVEDAEAGSTETLQEAQAAERDAAELPPQREDEHNLAPDANADGYLEIPDDETMPVAATGPAVADLEARRLNDRPEEASMPASDEPVPGLPDEDHGIAPAPDVPMTAEEIAPEAAKMDDFDMPAPDGNEDIMPEPPEQADLPPTDHGDDPGTKVVPEPSAEDIAPEPPAAAEAQPKKKGFFSRLREGLSKSSEKLSGGVSAIFTKRPLDDEMLEELEDLLISADLGLPATTRIIRTLTEERYDKEISPEEVRAILASEVAKTLEPLEKPLDISRGHKPHVILMTGVNGAGKTTTIGKLAKKFMDQGKSVMLAAGDTFRAAAVEQLQVWGERTGVPVITRPIGSDAAGLAFDALKEAKEQGVDVLMIDTAGRLQNRRELMDELAKIVRVIRKLDEEAPHDAILVLDATVGQNALSQAEAFSETAQITGLVMTKLDGTARGGVLVALADKFALPIHFIGVGEGVEDLQPFQATRFSRALAGLETQE